MLCGPLAILILWFSRSLSHASVACNKNQTSNFKNCVRCPMLAPACNVSVVRCGVWNAWGNGLPVVKIREHLETGCQVHHHAPHVEQHFVCLMSVCSLKLTESSSSCDMYNMFWSTSTSTNELYSTITYVYNDLYILIK
jgi:hypothetical protein